MTQKTRHILIGILIGVLTSVSSIVLIAFWNAKAPYKPYIPIYPNSSNGIRLIKDLGDPNIYIGTGTFSDQTTTFETSDTLHEILTYYLSAYQHEYKDHPCAIIGWDNPATNIRFNCTKSASGTSIITTTYSVEITISATSDSIKKVWVKEWYWGANELRSYQ